MSNVVNEIKNWHLFTDVFGDDYEMHDAVIKQFNLNGDDLIIVVNTLYKIVNDKVYDITIKFSKLIRFNYDTEIGNDYIHDIEVKRDKYYKNLFVFTFESASITVECFNIEVISVIESEPFQRGMICLNDPDQTADSGEMMWRG